MGPGTWMTSGPEAMGWGFWDLKKSSELRFKSRGRKSIFQSSPRRDQLGSTKWAARGGVRWKSQHRKKFVCVSLSLLMSKNLKLKKVIKSFIPEPISCFSDSYMRMNICERFPYRYEHMLTSGYITLFVIQFFCIYSNCNNICYSSC